MRKNFLVFLVILTACSSDEVLQESFVTVSGASVVVSKYLEKKKGMAIFFLSPECPLCKNYAVTIKKIFEDFESGEIVFLGVVSGSYYTTSEVRDFIEEYNLSLEILIDKEFEFASYFSASTTPEVVLIDANKKTRYQGAIDNWAISLGKKRLKVTEHYLRNAMTNLIVGKTITPQKTKPVGCFIE